MRLARLARRYQAHLGVCLVKFRMIGHDHAGTRGRCSLGHLALRVAVHRKSSHIMDDPGYRRAARISHVERLAMILHREQHG